MVKAASRAHPTPQQPTLLISGRVLAGAGACTPKSVPLSPGVSASNMTHETSADCRSCSLAGADPGGQTRSSQTWFSLGMCYSVCNFINAWIKWMQTLSAPKRCLTYKFFHTGVILYTNGWAVGFHAQTLAPDWTAPPPQDSGTKSLPWTIVSWFTLWGGLLIIVKQTSRKRTCGQGSVINPAWNKFYKFSCSLCQGLYSDGLHRGFSRAVLSKTRPQMAATCVI